MLTQPPFFRAWLHRSIYRIDGWDFGFFLAPEPLEEQEPGMMLRALIHVEGWLSFKQMRGTLFCWCADPAERATAIRALKEV